MMLTPPSASAGEQGAEYFFELILDALQRLTPEAQSLFLQKFLRSLIGVEVPESESISHWEGILRHRNQMAERLGRPVSLRAAAADYMDGTFVSHNATLVEYEELKRLRHDAATDPLTGLYNRRLFQEYMTKELARSRRYGSGMALLLFDLRNLKRVNDTYGHATGDAVLRGAAGAIRGSIRESDHGFRIGGDEFAVLLPQSESSNAHGLAQRIADKFAPEARSLAPDADSELNFGVASFPSDGENVEKLYEVADRNLYTQKGGVTRGAGEAPAEPALPALTTPSRQDSAAGGGEQPSRRRSVRVSVEGIGARGFLHDGFGDKEATLVDLGHGGIGFLVEETVQLPGIFYARLHVPPLKDVNLKFRKVYSHRVPQGLQRIGCCFAT
jgi:diguanylate cyclase (GGDEF)-like protein